jgi:hypothetical protein
MSDKKPSKITNPNRPGPLAGAPDLRSRMLRKVGSMAVLVGAALLAASYFAWQKQNETSAERVDAVVVTEGQGDKPPASWPTVQFTAPAGNIVRITGPAGTKQPAKGDHVAVQYDVLHPERTHIDETGNSQQQVYLVAGIGAAFVVFGLVYTISLRRMRAKH